jgi:hypothetical protein
MHVRELQRRITGTGGTDKTAVMGMLERGGKVRTMVYFYGGDWVAGSEESSMPYFLPYLEMGWSVVNLKHCNE